VRLFADHRDVRVAGGLVDRAVLAFLGGILGIMSVLLVTSTIGPRLGPTFTALQFFGYVALFLSVCLILRVIVAIARDSR
jgi:ubiquinone biosynthesis protein